MPRRLILRCHLCDPDGELIESAAHHGPTDAYRAALDHALDTHLDALHCHGVEALMGCMHLHPTGQGPTLAIPVPAAIAAH